MSSMRAGSLAMLPAGGRHRDWGMLVRTPLREPPRSQQLAVAGRGHTGCCKLMSTCFVQET